MRADERKPRLSKSRYLAGLQCPKRLWLEVHEPAAPELAPDPAQELLFAQGHRVGALAREYVPGGLLIDLPHRDYAGRVAATREALAGGARVVYEASFRADGVFVAVDILERRGPGFVPIEVKSTTEVREQHLPDVAIQTHVLRQAGLPVHRAELMHLNRDCRYPDLSDLFVREPVTRSLGPALREAPARIAALHEALAGPLPEVATGPHCTSPYACPFLERCRGVLPDHHVSTLHNVRSKRLEQLLAEGHVTILDLPEGFGPNDVLKRQVRSVRSGRLVAEPGLRRALARLRPPIAFLDFETVSPAIPVWNGCRPYDPVPVQMSCHVLAAAGLVHHAWLAEGAGDPRPALAEALLAACRGARTVVAYNASFERRCLELLAAGAPEHAAPLRAIAAGLEDLLPIVRGHVYHPDFGGSFSLKSVVPALAPELRYDDLAIQDGGTASARLTGLVLDGEPSDPDARRALCGDLEAYCRRDTLGLVRVYERLSELAEAG